ncbi:MAG: UDP-N-acetylglucosamine 2-epimerase, partial [Bacteroidales bacterium]|nr:UDP-N-acetylglucosamine 2-epimerase [Bacteroidales bacterium]
MKKIVAITTSRADYDLMSPLYRILNGDQDIDLRMLVSGSHLSVTFGLTIRSVEKDGLKILASIESITGEDTITSRIRSASLFLNSSIDIIADYQPDLIIYAGDREDVMVGALLGTYL